MPNITAGVDLGSTVYKQNTAGKLTFGAGESYSVPSYSPNVSPMMKKPAASSGVTPAPVRPVQGNNAWQPVNPYSDVTAGHQAVQDSVKAIMPGDGGMGDASVIQGGNKVTSDLSTIANADNPEAAQKSVMSDPFYQSNSFWSGMMRMGLKAMEGGSATDLYDAATQGFAQGQQEENLAKVKANAQANEQDLLQHYTPDSVANYIQTGDASQLRERKLTLEQQQEQKEADEEHEDQRQQARFEQQSKMQDASQRAAEERANQRQIQAENRANTRADQQQKALDEKYYRQDVANVRSQTATMRRNEQARLSGFGAAEENMKQYDDAKDDNSKNAALQMAMETTFNAINAGSSAERTMDKINHLLGKPGLVSVVNGKLTWASGIPNDQQAEYLKKLLHTDKTAWANTYKDDLYSIADAKISDPNDPQEVAKVLKIVNNGHGMKIKLTPEGYKDWQGSGEEENNTPSTSSKGVLSSSNTSNAVNNVKAKFGLH